MQITKAIITAAGADQVQLPLQTVVDRSGAVGTALGLLLDEVTSAGIEEVAVIVCPGQIGNYQSATRQHADRLTFFEQHDPKGYGDALLRAREFVGGQAFLHLVGDHLYVSRTRESCAKQLIDLAQREQCAVSAIQATRENKLGSFGAIGGSPVAQKPGLFDVTAVLEKPTPTVAEQHLIVAGQRAGHYLCLFGMHVLTPQIFELLDDAVGRLEAGQKVNLSDSLHQLAQSQRYLAALLEGERYDIGEKYGLVLAQLAIALSGDDRDSLLTELVELVAKR
jgi:UTP--glucose-1-phosphate uridylyltransferase